MRFANRSGCISTSWFSISFWYVGLSFRNSTSADGRMYSNSCLAWSTALYSGGGGDKALEITDSSSPGSSSSSWRMMAYWMHFFEYCSTSVRSTTLRCGERASFSDAIFRNCSSLLRSISLRKIKNTVSTLQVPRSASMQASATAILWI